MKVSESFHTLMRGLLKEKHERDSIIECVRCGEYLCAEAIYLRVLHFRSTAVATRQNHQLEYVCAYLVE